MVRLIDCSNMTSAVYCGLLSTNQSNLFQLKGAQIARLGEPRTLDPKVAGSILTRGAVLCP